MSIEIIEIPKCKVCGAEGWDKFAVDYAGYHLDYVSKNDNWYCHADYNMTDEEYKKHYRRDRRK